MSRGGGSSAGDKAVAGIREARSALERAEQRAVDALAMSEIYGGGLSKRAAVDCCGGGDRGSRTMPRTSAAREGRGMGMEALGLGRLALNGASFLARTVLLSARAKSEAVLTILKVGCLAAVAARPRYPRLTFARPLHNAKHG